MKRFRFSLIGLIALVLFSAIFCGVVAWCLREVRLAREQAIALQLMMLQQRELAEKSRAQAMAAEAFLRTELLSQQQATRATQATADPPIDESSPKTPQPANAPQSNTDRSSVDRADGR